MRNQATRRVSCDGGREAQGPIPLLDRARSTKTYPANLPLLLEAEGKCNLQVRLQEARS